ncbi:MAG TPA: hypothetical protein VLC09_02250, partial [Polyangiaceae bacterium]|nr:hypothetical protein [Polyangiaceae bacterium]
LPGTTNEVPPGAVRFELLAGSAELCFQALRTKSLGGELCAGFAAGAQSATARGYGNDSSADQPWFAVPVGLVVDLGQDERRALSEHLRLGLGALIPTDHRTFSVDGLGNVVDPAPVAGWFWLTGALSFAP